MKKKTVRLNIPLSLRVDNDLYDRIFYYAKDNGIDISSAVRMLLFKQTRTIKIKANATDKRL